MCLRISELTYINNERLCLDPPPKSEEEKMEECIQELAKKRFENNENWMDLMRCALKGDPETAKPIIRKILKTDKSVIETAEKLVE